MAAAKAIKLSVRPTQSADLCFATSGIIEYLPEALIGQTVSAFDLMALEDGLEPKVELPVTGSYEVTNLGNTGVSWVGPAIAGLQKIGDSPDDIGSAFAHSVLCRLRSKDIATNLLQALAWYGLKDSADQAADAIKVRNDLIGKHPNDPNSVPSLLSKLSTALKKRHDTLQSLYDQAGIGYVTDPTSASDSHTTTTGGQAFNTNSHTDTTFMGHDYKIPPAETTATYLRSEISLRQERLAAYRLVKMNSRENVQYAKAMTAADVRM